jgi:hypothetical protein
MIFGVVHIGNEKYLKVFMIFDVVLFLHILSGWRSLNVAKDCSVDWILYSWINSIKVGEEIVMNSCIDEQ